MEKNLNLVYDNFKTICYFILKELEKRTKIEIDNLNIVINLEPEKYDSYAFYDCDTNTIKLNSNDFTRFTYEENNFRRELDGRGFDYILAHEIGHYIHRKYFDLKQFNFNEENKIWNSYESKEEDFADCFADWLINNKDTLERNKEMENLLLKNNLLNV